MSLLLVLNVLCAAAMPSAAVSTFPLEDVRLLDGPFKANMERNAAWLLELEPDRLLAGVREDAGLPPKAARYGGWEQQGVASHSLGHHLSACALQYAATGDSRFKERVDYIVEELALCQNANGDGYVSAIPDGKRAFAEIARGEIKAENFQLNGIWVPWYTMHKLFAGLRDAYIHAKNDQALEVYTALGDWACRITEDLSPEQMQEMMRCEHGGINETAADLYALIGDEKYLALARRFTHKAVFDPMAAGNDILDGLHANTQIPKFTGAARIYELTGDTYYHDAARFFWTTVANHHSYVTGGHSDHEHFGPPDKLNDRLSTKTTETCNTYNMLKLTRHLFEWEAAPEYADFYERALFNHILGSQNPDTAEVTYYVPLESGRMKTYQTKFETFSCCVGTGMENHTRYGEAIYFHNADSLYVNLFIASELTWKEKGIVVRQETGFPTEDQMCLTFQCKNPADLTVYLRRPAWAKTDVGLAVNSEIISVTAEQRSFMPVQRRWRDGDTITWRCPMAVHTESMPDNPDRVALFYGPVLLAGALGEKERVPAEMPVLITGDKPVNEWLTPVDGKVLTFITNEIGYPEEIELIPFYNMHHQRHIVYWDKFTKEQWDERQAAYQAELERKQQLETRTVDFVQPGEMQPERDHQFEGVNSRHGMHLDRKWRDAADGGWFAFTVKVDPNRPVELVCTYWGSDSGSRIFDIVVDGIVIATQKLDNPAPNAFVDITYQIPKELTAGKESVRVKFQAHPSMMAGGVFGCRIVYLD